MSGHSFMKMQLTTKEGLNNSLFTLEVKLMKDAKEANNKKQMNTRKTLSISSTDLSFTIQYFVFFQGLMANLHGVEFHTEYCTHQRPGLR